MGLATLNSSSDLYFATAVSTIAFSSGVSASYLAVVLPAITSVAASLTFLTDSLVLTTSSSVGCAAFNFCASRAAIALGYKSSSVTLGSINLLSVPEVNADSPLNSVFGAITSGVITSLGVAFNACNLSITEFGVSFGVSIGVSFDAFFDAFLN
jgi:hypothetical protein